MSENINTTTTKAYIYLYTAIYDHEPAERIVNLIEADPKAVQRRGILEKACCYPDYDSVILKILDIYPFAAQQNSRDSGYGRYPLHDACQHGQPESVIQKLIEIFPGAVTSKDSSNRYPLHLACQCRKAESYIGKLIAMYPAALQEKGEDSYPIHYAVSAHQSVEVIRRILDADSSVLHQKDEYGRTPFHLACMTNATASLVEYFLQYPNIGINLPDLENCTPLHCACIENVADVVISMLLQHPDININAKDMNGNTPLHHLVDWDVNPRTLQKLIPVIRMLIDHRLIDIHQKNNENVSPVDLINKKIAVLEKRVLGENEKRALPLFVEIKRLFEEEFPTKRKWRQHNYLLFAFTKW